MQHVRRLLPTVMGTLLLCLVLGTSLGLGGCSTVTPTGGSVSVVDNGQYGLEATYNLAATAFLRKADWKTPADREAARAVLVKAYAAVLLARTARAAGDAPTVTSQALLIADALAQIQVMTK